MCVEKLSEIPCFHSWAVDKYVDNVNNHFA